MKRKPKVTKESLETVLTSMADSFAADLFAKQESELDGEYWHFRYDPTRSLEANLYSFFDLLGLYARCCRRWEEHHHGHICVVERVRDKYIMPKIRALVRQLAIEDPASPNPTPARSAP